jgi:hypothetical protein
MSDERLCREERNFAPAAFLPADRPEIEQAFK